MTRNYANIVTAIWRDDDWRALEDRDQRAYMMLVTQPNISAAGVLPMTIARWAAMAGNTKPADIRAMLARLDAASYIAVDEDTEEVLIRSFVRHDKGYGNEKRRPVIERAAGEIESRRLRRVLAGELIRLGLPPEWALGDQPDPDSPPEGPGDRASDRQSDRVAKPNRAASAANPPPNGRKTESPQVNSLSGRHPGSPSDAVSPSEGVVVTKGPYIETSTHNPQSSSPVAARRASDETDDDQPTEDEQTILDSLHAEGHHDATPADARTIHRALVARYRDRVSLRYLRGIAAGSGFSEFYDAARRDRERADAERERAERRRGQAAAERAAIDACDLCDRSGRTPAGGICSHDPDLPARTRRGGAQVRAELARRQAKDTAA